MTLSLAAPIEDAPGMRGGIVNYLTKTDGMVCQTCGLEAFGHGPQSEYLGHDKHDFTGIIATDKMLADADKLSRAAYRMRCELELCGAYCISIDHA